MERFKDFHQEPIDQPERAAPVEREYDPEQRERVMSLRAEHVMADYFQRHKNTALAEDVRSGTTSFERAYRILKETGGQDPKTNLLRTELLNASMDFEMWNSRETGQTAVVAMFDIDHFRAINEELTHIGADKVLKRVADIIAESVRVSDDELRVSRYGGEEFALLLTGSNVESARGLVNKIREQIERELADVRPNGERVTVSAGLAAYVPTEAGAKEKQADDWLQEADQQLLLAKQAGRNRVFPERAADAA